MGGRAGPGVPAASPPCSGSPAGSPGAPGFRRWKGPGPRAPPPQPPWGTRLLPALLSVADTCFPPPLRLSKAWEQRVTSGLAFPPELGPGLSLVPRGAEPGPGCWGGWVQAPQSVPALTGREGAPADMGPSLESVCWACPRPGGKRVLREALPWGAAPQACFLSLRSPHPGGAGGETEAWGPSGRAAFLLPPLPLTGQLPRELPVLFSDHCWKALPTSGQRRPPWGFRATSPAPQPQERLQAGWRCQGCPGPPLPSWPHHSCTPWQAPAPPDSPGVGGGNSRESPRLLTHG